MATPVTARNHLGPLTTTFTAASSCFTPSLTAGEGFYGATLGLACDGSPLNIYLDDECFPPQMSEYIARDVPDLGTIGYFWPAPSCPVGYTKACSLSRTIGDTAPAVTGLAFASNDVYSLLKPGETIVGCCVSGYSCNDMDPNYCTSSGYADEEVTGFTYGGLCTSVPSSFTIDGSQVSPIGLHLRMHLMSATTSPANIEIQTTSNTYPTMTSTLPPSDNDTSRTLSATSKIALGVIIAGLFLIMVIIFLAYLLLRKRRSAAAAPKGAANRDSTDSAHGTYAGEKPELDATTVTLQASSTGYEPSSATTELTSDRTSRPEAAELPGSDAPWELYGQETYATELASDQTAGELPGAEVAAELSKKNG